MASAIKQKKGAGDRSFLGGSTNKKMRDKIKAKEG